MSTETTKTESEEVRELLDAIKMLLEQFQYISKMHPRAVRLSKIHEKHRPELQPGYIFSSICSLEDAYEVFAKYRGHGMAGWLKPSPPAE